MLTLVSYHRLCFWLQAFESIVRSKELGRAVAELAGWEAGARVANDQVWAKPPGAAPITFHRDSAYFDFTPSDVVTVWLALDSMSIYGNNLDPPRFPLPR
jgi:hypothetical protein